MRIRKYLLITGLLCACPDAFSAEGQAGLEAGLVEVKTSRRNPVTGFCAWIASCCTPSSTIIAAARPAPAVEEEETRSPPSFAGRGRKNRYAAAAPEPAQTSHQSGWWISPEKGSPASTVRSPDSTERDSTISASISGRTLNSRSRGLSLASAAGPSPLRSQRSLKLPRKECTIPPTAAIAAVADLIEEGSHNTEDGEEGGRSSSPSARNTPPIGVIEEEEDEKDAPLTITVEAVDAGEFFRALSRQQSSPHKKRFEDAAARFIDPWLNAALDGEEHSQQVQTPDGLDDDDDEEGEEERRDPVTLLYGPDTAAWRNVGENQRASNIASAFHAAPPLSLAQIAEAARGRPLRGNTHPATAPAEPNIDLTEIPAAPAQDSDNLSFSALSQETGSEEEDTDPIKVMDVGEKMGKGRSRKMRAILQERKEPQVTPPTEEEEALPAAAAALPRRHLTVLELAAAAGGEKKHPEPPAQEPLVIEEIEGEEDPVAFVVDPLLAMPAEANSFSTGGSFMSVEGNGGPITPPIPATPTEVGAAPSALGFQASGGNTSVVSQELAEVPAATSSDLSDGSTT